MVYRFDLLGIKAQENYLKKRLQSPRLAQLNQLLVGNCDSFFEESSPQFLDHQRREKPFWHSRQGIFVVPVALRNLAISFFTTGQARYGEAARHILLAIIRERLADTPSVAWGTATSGWRNMAGHDKFLFVMGLWPVLEFCFDLFTGPELEEVADYFVECISISDQHRSVDDQQITNNRGIRGVLATALFALGASFFREVAGLDEMLTRAVINLEKHLFFAFDSTGAPYEGPQYAGNCLPQLALVAHILQRRGLPNLLFHRAFERLPSYFLYEWIPGADTVNNLNDACHPCGTSAGSLFWMGKPSGATIPWLAERLEFQPTRLAETDPQENLVLKDFLNYLLWWDDTIPVLSPEKLRLPLSRHFSPRGVASHRTGWTENDVLVSHFCGRHEVYCHRQGDANHIALYACGEHFLVDAGYGNGAQNMNQKMNRWFGLTESHNCVLIDRMNQRGVPEAPGWAEGEMLFFENTAQGSSSCGDASSATGPNHRVTRSIRQIFLDRGSAMPFVLVFDWNEKDGQSFAAETRWHTQPGNRLEPQKNGWLISGGKADCSAQVWAYLGRVEISFHEDHGRPQVQVSQAAASCRSVTLFLPALKGAVFPDADFAFETEQQGRLILTGKDGTRYERRFRFGALE